MTQREQQILQWIREDPQITQQELAERAGITRSSAAVHISNLMKKGLIKGRGYIVSGAPYAVVVGGVNIDIGGRSHDRLRQRDSNPGRVQVCLGGVGRNIAHNMALLGVDTRMVTVFGDDFHAQRIISSCGELGIDISKSLQIPGESTSTYLYIAGRDGDMALALSDMEIYRHITPEFLAARAPLLQGAGAVVVDANIPAESIEWLAGHVKAPIFADPVSVAKADRLRPALGRLHALKPNTDEAKLLSGVDITDEASLNRAADVLLDTGLERVFLSMGADGVLAAGHTGRVRLPNPPGNMVNTTGCGDAFMAALVWAHLNGLGLEESAKAGLAAASIAMEGSETINPLMSEVLLKSRMDEKHDHI